MDESSAARLLPGFIALTAHRSVRCEPFHRGPSPARTIQIRETPAHLSAVRTVAWSSRLWELVPTSSAKALASSHRAAIGFDSAAHSGTLRSMTPVPAAAELLTVEDYRATPEGSRYQLVEGDLFLMSRAANLFHQAITGKIHQILANFLEQSRLGRVFIAPCDVYLSEHDVVQPDVLFVATANLGILAEDGIHGAPDLVTRCFLRPPPSSTRKPNAAFMRGQA
jgi:hypothetical protein